MFGARTQPTAMAPRFQVKVRMRYRILHLAGIGYCSHASRGSANRKKMEEKKRGGGLGSGGFVVKTGSGLVAKGWEKEGRQGRG